jgi:BirA family biotin operon repressor/biotin-[acetyl-CoA-carboxylase] ligase
MSAAPGHPLEWGAGRLYHQLSQCVPNLGVEVVAQIGSTNTALLERARVAHRLSSEVDLQSLRSPEGVSFGRRDADYQPCLLVAEHQTHGRDASGAATGRPWIGIKWPNDLWLMPPRGEPGAGRKLGGLLIETVPAGALRLAVVGVGLNVLPMALDATQAASGFACLQELDAEASAPGVLHRVALPLVEALQQFSRGGFAAFAERFARRDVLQGCSVQAGDGLPAGTPGAVAGGGALTGVADGVAGNGALRVRTLDGLREVISGEVSVRVSPADRESSC